MALYTKIGLTVTLLIVSVAGYAGFYQHTTYSYTQLNSTQSAYARSADARANGGRSYSGYKALYPTSSFYSTSAMRGRMLTNGADETYLPGSNAEPGKTNESDDSYLPGSNAEPGENPGTPIGSAWVLLIFVALYGAICLFRRHKTII